jgi:uncharacterized protein with PQ loop repeat
MNWWCYQICIKTVESNNLIYDNTPQSIAAGIIYLISVVCRLNTLKVKYAA